MLQSQGNLSGVLSGISLLVVRVVSTGKENQAAKTYDKKAIELFKEFAYTNF